MKAVVTGANGFIGGNLMRRLISDGNYVMPIEKDILESPIWKDTLTNRLDNDKPDVVFHLGAITDTLATDVNEMMMHNYDFTYGLALWCSVNNVPFIFSSSASIYSHNKSLYAWSKQCAESIVSELGGISLRYFNVYGGGEENKGAMASIMYQGWLKHLQGEEVLLFPSKPQRDFIYIDDVIDANLHAFKNYADLKRINIGSYDVGIGEANSFERVMELMGFKYKVCDVWKAIPKYYQWYTLAFESRFLPDWKPKFTLEQGTQAYLQYLKNKKNDSTNDSRDIESI